MTKTNEERIEFYAQKIIELKAKKQELEEAEKNYRAKLSELIEDGTTLHGEYKLNRRENRRFDAALAKKNLEPELLEKISVSKPDSTLAKAHLSEDDLTKCQKVFGVVVTVDLRDD